MSLPFRPAPVTEPEMDLPAFAAAILAAIDAMDPPPPAQVAVTLEGADPHNLTLEQMIFLERVHQGTIPHSAPFQTIDPFLLTSPLVHPRASPVALPLRSQSRPPGPPGQRGESRVYPTRSNDPITRFYLYAVFYHRLSHERAGTLALLAFPNAQQHRRGQMYGRAISRRITYVSSARTRTEPYVRYRAACVALRRFEEEFQEPETEFTPEEFMEQLPWDEVVYANTQAQTDNSDLDDILRLQ